MPSYNVVMARKPRRTATTQPTEATPPEPVEAEATDSPPATEEE